MAQHARIEEISDTDSDPEIQDISSLAPPSFSTSTNPSLINPSTIPSASTHRGPQITYTTDASVSKTWPCLYPVYFDVSRTRDEGRRVKKESAVMNPLAKQLADAVSSLGLRCVFEPGKTHPKDWSNPGRVRVRMVEGGEVKNKHHLYILVAEYLRRHPTTPTDVLKLQIRGMPEQKEPLPPPAVPRGWKVNEILPLHSPAVTGGGVSENFLKDMMAEMQGLPQGSGQEKVEKKKDKKDKKKK